MLIKSVIFISIILLIKSCFLIKPYRSPLKKDYAVVSSHEFLVGYGDRGGTNREKL